MMEQHLLNGDSAEVLKTLKDNSVDLLATDPPYAIGFMGKEWDKVLPPTDIWKECYRVLKPGSFIAVMSSPRSDVLYRMIKDLEDAGFDMSFSPIMWTYHTGFPKASDTSKMIDKRKGRITHSTLQLKQIIIDYFNKRDITKKLFDDLCEFKASSYMRTESREDDGWGEAVPSNEKWDKIKEVLHIDTNEYDELFYEAQRESIGKSSSGIGKAFTKEGWNSETMEFDITEASTDLAKKYEGSKLGFQPKPAVEHIIIGMKPHGSKSYIDNVLNFEALPDNIKMTYPFLQVPKPAKKEKDFGLTGEDKPIENHSNTFSVRMENGVATNKRTDTPRKNIHPTTKPVKLMSYIITLFTREGDWVLDPFLGSGTTGLASKLLNRNFIGVEREKEYFDICEERLSVDRDELIKFFKDKK
jgi:site-specific DNA-methyltransferase (adenine-specific)